MAEGYNVNWASPTLMRGRTMLPGKADVRGIDRFDLCHWCYAIPSTKVVRPPHMARASTSLENMAESFAHSGSSEATTDWQLLRDHLAAVASRAADNARPFGLDRLAHAAGLLHDLGKYDPRFQQRLHGANIRVDHSTAGAWFLRNAVPPSHQTMAEIVSYCILGHHAGLPDRYSSEPGCFERRVKEHLSNLDPVWQAELQFDLKDLEPPAIFRSLSREPEERRAFDLSVVARFLFSALVDADFRDTEDYYIGLGRRQADRKWESLVDLLPEFTAKFDAHMAGLPVDGEVNPLRREILAHVRANATMSPGLFTLSVPTGGGKTLASLGFALDHAARHGHRRIVVAIPFTSIVDQTADTFRTVLGPEHILEHHSAIDEEEGRPGHHDRKHPDTSGRMRLAMEDWAAPVIVTTNVQLFESLFAARTSRARKLHNIAGSIIVLDEAQTIPRPLLKPCVYMLDTLARMFGCTIVLCTATQPALGKESADGRPGFPNGLDLSGRELAPDPVRLARKLKRCRIVRCGEMDNATLVEALSRELQALVIVNSRKHALDLYKETIAAGLDGVVHLTTRQCAAHRRKILADVRERLKGEAPCRVVATSLIEAGVDVDFPKVWRAEAGWDQIMQAAGRANREGRRPVEESIVTVFEAPDYPAPAEIRSLVGDTERALVPLGDIQSPEAIERYFREVYWRMGERLDGREAGKAILPRLKFDPRLGTDFSFRSIAADFRMIDSTMAPVIVPYDDAAKEAVKLLSVEQISSGALARKLQIYVVQTPPKARELLMCNGHAAYACQEQRGGQFVVLTNGELYTEEMGLLWEDAAYLTAENSFI